MNAPTRHDHTNNDDLEGRLGRRLRSTPIELPSAPGPHAAADRAQQRSRRRRSSLVAVAAVALVGGIAGPMLLDDDPDEGVNTDFAAPIDADGVELDWQVHEGGLSMVRSADEGADGFYALSTAPGTRWQEFPDGHVPRALYRWSDGSWQPLELGDDAPNVAKVSERAGTLYGLSTSAETGGPVGSFSADGGQTWTSVPLGDIRPPSDDVAWGMSVQLNLASTADTTIGVVSTKFVPPAEDLFPELTQELEAGHGFYSRTSDAGVELVEYTAIPDDPDAAGAPSSETTEPGDSATEAERAEVERAMVESEESVVRTITWAELGVSDRSALGPHVATYAAEAGEWTPLDSAPLTANFAELTATDSAILFHGTTYDHGTGEESTTVLSTTDGTTWTDVPMPAGSTWGRTAMAPDGNLIHVADQGGGLDAVTVSVSTDLGGSWSQIDIGELVPEIGAARDSFLFPVSGPLGVALSVTGVTGDDTRISRLLFSTDLQSWTVTDLDALAPDDAPIVSGDVLVGTDHILIRTGAPSDPDDDEPGNSATLVATPVR